MIRSRFWDDLADDLRSTRLRRVFLRAYIRFASRVPYVRRTPVEAGLRARRCRCGKLATEVAPGCARHASVSARYAADLAAALDVAARVVAEAERLSPGAATVAWYSAADEARFASPAMAQGLREWLAGDVEDA